MSSTRAIHLSLWIVGGALLLTAVGAATRGAWLSRQDVRAFEQARSLAPAGPPDTAAWSARRVAAYREASLDDSGLPMAVLRIPALELEAAVLPGTDERTLDRGIGWIEGTARPGEPGNVGLAAHRDGFFRGLRDIAAGDAIEVETLDGVHRYEVERFWVVSPEDVEVLAPTGEQTVTLVTCFPFYYVGSAPERFIVRGRHVGTDPYFDSKGVVN